MPRNTNKTPYMIPSKWHGYEIANSTLKWERTFYTVVKAMARAETLKYGRTISIPTLLMNLALRDPELRARYDAEIRTQTNQENTNETQDQPTFP